MNEQELLSEIRDGLAPELAGLDPNGECLPGEALERARQLLLKYLLKVDAVLQPDVDIRQYCNTSKTGAA